MQTIDEFARAKRNEYKRRWREKHREQYNAYQRKRNAENKSKRAAYTKKWREANRERYNAYHREYYAKKKMEHICTDDVTHWMPVPEPPKEEEK